MEPAPEPQDFNALLQAVLEANRDPADRRVAEDLDADTPHVVGPG
jgi:hypothetical protein